MTVQESIKEAKWAFWAVLAFGAAICFSHIHQGTLAVDAIRYAYISDTILKSGEWFALTDGLTGEAYVNKPPLLFWTTALSFELFGYSTFSAKLPGALASFCALILLFKLVERLANARAALLAVILFALTRNFMRSMVDLSFEGIAASGALVCLIGLMRWVEKGKPSAESSWLVAGGLLLLLMSKPPYLLLVSPAIGWVAIRGNARLKDLLIIVSLVVLGSSWWWLMPKDLLFAAYDNQVALPIREAASPIKNFGMWCVSLFKNYPLLAICGIFGLVHMWRTKSYRELRQQTLLLWIAPLLAVFLLIDVRPRYILVPIIGLTVLAGIQAAQLSKKLSLQMLSYIVLFIALVLTVFSFSGKRVHRSDPLVEIARNSTAQEFCVARDEAHKQAGQNRMAEMLIELETGKKVRAYSPAAGEACPNT